MEPKTSNDKTAAVNCTKITIELINFEETLPNELVSLSEEYLSDIPKLMSYISTGTQQRLTLQRIEINGTITKKTMTGKVSKINLETNSFYFFSEETFCGPAFEGGKEIFIRTDNVLGIIPTIPIISSHQKINPYANSHTEKAMSYFEHLKKMKYLAKMCIGTTHKASLFFNHGNDEITVVDCEILKINRSNIEVTQYRSILHKKGQISNISLGKISPKTKLNICINNYLYKISVVFGEEHKIHVYDEGYTGDKNEL